MTTSRGKVVLRDDIDPVPWLGEEGRFLLRAEDHTDRVQWERGINRARFAADPPPF